MNAVEITVMSLFVILLGYIVWTNYNAEKMELDRAKLDAATEEQKAATAKLNAETAEKAHAVLLRLEGLDESLLRAARAYCYEYLVDEMDDLAASTWPPAKYSAATDLIAALEARAQLDKETAAAHPEHA